MRRGLMVGFVNQHDHHLNGGLIEKMFYQKKQHKPSQKLINNCFIHLHILMKLRFMLP